MLITVIILTKNEENNILDCLHSISYVDEIIIIDDNSTDRTIDLAKSFGHEKLKVISQALNGDFSKQRNLGVSKATNDWILFLDADERVDKSLKQELQDKIDENSNVQGYFLKRVDNFLGKDIKHGEAGNLSILRFAKKESGFWKGKVHEVWKIKGKAGFIKSPLIHFPHKTIKEFIDEVNFYSDLRAQELFEKNVKVGELEILTFPFGKFLVNYFLKLGFLDGLSGFIYAVIMSFHSFLVRGKTYLLWRKKQKSLFPQF